MPSFPSASSPCTSSSSSSRSVDEHPLQSSSSSPLSSPFSATMPSTPFKQSTFGTSYKSTTKGQNAKKKCHWQKIKKQSEGRTKRDNWMNRANFAEFVSIWKICIFFVGDSNFHILHTPTGRFPWFAQSHFLKHK